MRSAQRVGVEPQALSTRAKRLDEDIGLRQHRLQHDLGLLEVDGDAGLARVDGTEGVGTTVVWRHPSFAAGVDLHHPGAQRLEDRQSHGRKVLRQIDDRDAIERRERCHRDS